MFKIVALNKISDAGMCHLEKSKYEIVNEIAASEPDGIILRSADIRDVELPKSLKTIARAGAGVNNIPVERCSERGIVVFNTPGANANAVKELVLAGLLLSSRRIVEGVNWTGTLRGQTDVSKTVEKEKGRFAGPELFGKRLGVIGLGAIGVLVANSCNSLGMEVMGYDPYISVDAAWSLSRGVHKATSFEAIFSQCDYITLHIPLNKNTKGLINKEMLSKAKKGVRILNFSRGELVESQDIKDAVNNGDVSCYVTDFPSDEIICHENILTIPHLGASTPESEDNCAIMAAISMRDYLEVGNIKNSVNFPDCELLYTGKRRICVSNKNIPNVISSLTGILSSHGINIDNMTNRSNGDYAYTIIDVDGDINGAEKELAGINGVISVRII